MDQDLNREVLHARLYVLVEAVKGSGVPRAELHTGLALLGLGMHQLFAAGVSRAKVASTIAVLMDDPRFREAIPLVSL